MLRVLLTILNASFWNIAARPVLSGGWRCLCSAHSKHKQASAVAARVHEKVLGKNLVLLIDMIGFRAVQRLMGGGGVWRGSATVSGFMQKPAKT